MWIEHTANDSGDNSSLFQVSLPIECEQPSNVEKPESVSYSETNASGALAEIRFAALASQRGYSVFMPLCHATKTDVVIKMDGTPCVSVQVKKATLQGGAIWKFMVGSGLPSCAYNKEKHGLRYRTYKSGDFDLIAAHVAERNSWVFYELDSVCGKSSIRIQDPAFNDEGNWKLVTEIMRKKQP